MKRAIPMAWLVTALAASSAVLFGVDFFVFGSLRADLAFYTLLDLAFIPVNVLVVGLFLNRLMSAREREELLHKMNIVVGAFFTEAGHDLIARLSTFDGGTDHDREFMLFDADWTVRDYARNRAKVGTERHRMDLSLGDAEGLRSALVEKRSFMLGLLQNGNLLEHASFTDMLWAVSHLSEELAVRRDLDDICEADRKHLELDMSRAYGRLLSEWLGYVQHLQYHYPYMFSFAVRTNPFAAEPDVQVRQ